MHENQITLNSKSIFLSLIDSSGQNEKPSETGVGKINNQGESALARKISSALKRPLSKQPSNSSDHSSSSTTTFSVPRRKISVTDPPSTKELSRLHKTYSHGALQVTVNASLNRPKARSTEMINIASTQTNGNTLSDTFPPSLRKFSSESFNRAASPLFYRRKLSHNHSPSLSSPPRPIRKISCPSKMQHHMRVHTHQEEVIPFQLSRVNNGSTSRSSVAMATELPKLSVSRVVEQVAQFDESECPLGNVSPLGLHVDGMDSTLQEKVNNFLRSLERSDDGHEPEERTCSRCK